MINGSGWHKLLELASLGGWEPAGTVMYHANTPYWDGPIEDPDQCDPDWGGGYDTNDCQTVTESDAASMANALEELLNNIRDYEASNPKPSKLTLALSRMAASMANALEELLDDIRDYEGADPKPMKLDLALSRMLEPRPSYEEQIPREEARALACILGCPSFSKDEPASEYYEGHLRRFVKFCRAGEFVIW